MTNVDFNRQVRALFQRQEELLSRKNLRREGGNGIFDRYVYPV